VELKEYSEYTASSAKT